VRVGVFEPKRAKGLDDIKGEAELMATELEEDNEAADLEAEFDAEEDEVDEEEDAAAAAAATAAAATAFAVAAIAASREAAASAVSTKGSVVTCWPFFSDNSRIRDEEAEGRYN